VDHLIKEAIILAGGLGTRLRDSIGDLPKPLAPINSLPFLHYLFDYLKNQNIQSVVLSVGYHWEMIQKEFNDEYLGIQIKYAVEKEALGTGGGIKLALELIDGENCFVLNGDTYFDIVLNDLKEFHFLEQSECTIAAKHLTDFERYGTMDINTNGTVTAFLEKEPKQKGDINGGIYCLNKSILNSFPAKNKFSFETDYLEPNAGTKKIKAKVFVNYFMDIGIPEDYTQFGKDILEKEVVPIEELGIDKEWTLFLDRDGVINTRLIDDYVKQLNELKIIDGVPEAIGYFSKLFSNVLVVTNQQGIGKGTMTEVDLEIIHGYMNNIFQDFKGKIDKFYFAPQLASENSNYRKPGTGMGLEAKKDFPEINFSKSILIGDSESDIEFGMKLGMKTIMLTKVRNLSSKADYIFDNLQAVAKEFKTSIK
jgi:D-glycero-alpha-D-manno-heptose 1-phosphate guanylyltransferase